MDKLIVIEKHIDVTALTPDEQILLALLVEVPLARLLQYLRVLSHWEQAESARKALALKLLNARLSDKDVARVCGLSDRQLRRYPEYRAFCACYGSSKGCCPPARKAARAGWKRGRPNRKCPVTLNYETPKARAGHGFGNLLCPADVRCHPFLHRNACGSRT